MKQALASIETPALLRIASLVAAVVGVLLLLASAYLGWGSFRARAMIEQAASDAGEVASGIAQRIVAMREALVQPAFQDEVDATDGLTDERERLIAALRSQGLRNVLNLVVARGPVELADLSAFPGGGFAVLEMLVRARDSDDVPVQVHFPGTPDEYLAMARRLRPDDPDSAVVLATFPVSVLFNQIELPASISGMRLIQRVGNEETVLEEYGTFSGSGGARRLPVAGSLFELAWDRPVAVTPLSHMQVLGLAGAGVLCLVLSLQLRRRLGGVSPAAATPQERKRGATGKDDTTARPVDEGVLAGALPAGPVVTDGGTEVIRPDESGTDHSADTANQQERQVAGTEDEDAPLLGSDEETADDAAQVPEEPAEAESGEGTEVGLEFGFDDLLEDGSAPDGASPPREDRATGDDREAPEASGEASAEASKADALEAATEELVLDPDVSDEDEAELDQLLSSLVDDDAEVTEPEAFRQPPAATEPMSSGEAPPAGRPEYKKPEPGIFRAYDIRGVVGQTLDADVARAIGLAIGSEAVDRGLSRICVARDGRLSGAELLGALSEGLMGTGLEVIDVGAVPTPVLYYAAEEIGGGSGVMVTGSHNPPDYNGFKIVLGGETLYGEAITALYERLDDGRIVTGRGTLHEESVVERYIARIATDIQLERSLKVVADCGNGIAGAVAPQLLGQIGASVIPLYAEVDGTFPNHHPDPGDPATLEDLKLCVRNFSADLGVAFDGDGDRLGVVAPDGEIIYPDRLMMLFARDVLSRVPGAPVIYDVKCSSLLAGEIEAAGGKPVMTRTGHSFIKAELKREQAPLAGEMSGHFFFGERWYGFDDGLYAACRLLEILAADSRPAGEILAALPKAVSTPELKLEMAEGEPHAFVERFKAQAKLEGARLVTLDGVRAEFEDGFGLLRASNTTPVVVLRFEGRDEEALTRIQDQFREAMLAVDPDLKLPF